MTNSICGIYRITHLPTNRHYIGQSVDIAKRWQQHRQNLTAGNHHSALLQEAWNVDGEEAFEFVVVIRCDRASLNDNEKLFMQAFHARMTGFNRQKVNGSKAVDIYDDDAGVHYDDTLVEEWPRDAYQMILRLREKVALYEANGRLNFYESVDFPMKTGDLVKQFGVSDTTIRRWVAEFEEFLSENAKQTRSKHRSFTSDDFLVLATVHELSKENYPLNVIREKLAEGYRVDDTTASTIGYSDGRMVPAIAVEQIIDSTELRIELEQARAERDKLLEMLGNERLAHEKTRQEMEVKQEKIREDLQKKIDSLQDRINELVKSAAIAETRLEVYREQQSERQNQRDD